MKKILLTVLMVLLMTVQVFGATATIEIEWDTINDPDIAGFEINEKVNTGAYAVVDTALPSATSWVTVKDIGEGTTDVFYYTVTTVDANGLKSYPSNEVDTGDLDRPPVVIIIITVAVDASGNVTVNTN